MLIGVVGEHEDIRVIRRFVAPPAFPWVVRPVATNRSEHVAAEDPCADVGEAASCKIVVDAASMTLTIAGWAY
jgi:hypothetical protein